MVNFITRRDYIHMEDANKSTVNNKHLNKIDVKILLNISQKKILLNNKRKHGCIFFSQNQSKLAGHETMM